MDAVFWWVGGSVCFAIAAFLFAIVVELCIGVACAVSWCRWSHRLMVTHGRKPHWLSLPRAFLGMTWELAGHKNTGKTQWNGCRGYWRGIGDWAVFPPADQQENGR